MVRVNINVKERLFYIDNLRLLIIVSVVIYHLACIYSCFGYSGFGLGFYPHIERTSLDLLSTIWFGFYLEFQQGYFMGILFMIAGYFVAGSYDRKGFCQFIGERFKRLVIPSLIYMVIITPFVMYGEFGINWFQLKLGLIPIFLQFLSGIGVMWFAVALFIFSVIYGLVRLIADRPSPISNGKQIKPSLINAILLILTISVCVFLIRIVQPIATNILTMQICYFASYVIFFIVGILAFRNNLFAEISYQTGKRWLICGILVGFISWLVLMKASGAIKGMTALNGGLTWQSAGFSIWESFVAVAMSTGLIALFRERFNYQSKFIKKLYDNSFAVYMFHPPIIVAVALLFRPVALSPIVKWIMLCIICVPLCFAAIYFVIRRIPLLKNIL